MKKNIFWTIWGVTSFICVFIAGYKSFAEDLKTYKQKLNVKIVNSVNEKKVLPKIKVLEISMGDREKLATVKFAGEVFTICAGMNISNSYKVVSIEDDHITICSIKEPNLKFLQFISK